MHPQICQIANISEKIKMPKFATKNAFFGYSWTRISKKNCHVWNHHPQFCLIAKFSEKTKMPKFGTKNAFFV